MTLHSYQIVKLDTLLVQIIMKVVACAHISVSSTIESVFFGGSVLAKQLNLKPWCIASPIVLQKSGGAEAPLPPPPPPLSTPLHGN